MAGALSGPCHFNPRGSQGAATHLRVCQQHFCVNFNPRGSQGAATGFHRGGRGSHNISIHAARREPRPHETSPSLFKEDISIHAARREPRPDLLVGVPGRGGISIHAARREPRPACGFVGGVLDNFNPRGSQGAATLRNNMKAERARFQSTRLAGSRDAHRAQPGYGVQNFNPRGSQGAAT